MTVERKCLECGSSIPPHQLSCKACGVTYKVSEDLMKSYGDLPEPPLGEWVRENRITEKSRRKFSRKNKFKRKKRFKSKEVFEADYGPSLEPNPSKTSYNIFVGFFILVILLLVPYFKNQLVIDPRILPYSLLGLTTLITILAIVRSNLYANLLMVPNLIVKNKEYYRIVSSGFTHINGTHLLLNGFAMFSFGPPLMQFLIDAYGFTAPVLFVIFYLLSISFADLPDLIRHRRNAEYSSVGASGATSAVVAAAAIADPGLQITFIFFAGSGEAPSIPGIFYAIGFLLISLYLNFKGRDGVAHLAHASGLVFGFLAMAIVSAQLNLNLYGNLKNGIQSGDLTSVTKIYIDNNSMLIQLNGRGNDVWSEASLEGWTDWGAKKIYSTQDCSIVIFKSRQLAEAMFSDWENVGVPDYYAWNVNDKLVLSSKTNASCVQTSGRVLGVSLTD